MRPSASPPIDATIALVSAAAGMGGSTVAAAASPSSAPAVPTPRRYDTRVGPTPPSPYHPRLSRRAPPPKKARTSGPGESSSSRP